MRVALFAVLGLFEPVVRVVLSFLSLAGFLTAGLYYFLGSPRLDVSYGILLTFAFGCALALVLYEALLRVSEP